MTTTMKNQSQFLSRLINTLPPSTLGARGLKHCLRSVIVLLTIVALLICTTGQVAAQTKATYFHNDLSGNPVAASDSTGQIIWRESYRPYGERLKNDAASQTNSQWYTGHRQDADTGLVYMGARHYDPLMGRFLSIDPAGLSESNPHSFNRYAYANNNPMKFVDPDGRAGVLVAVGVGLLLVGGGAIISQMSPERRVELAQEISGKLRSLSNPSISYSPGPIVSKAEEKSKDSDSKGESEPEREKTPSTNPENFESVKGSKGKRDKESGEIWEKDQLHKDHYEVYKNKREYENGKRDRDVWNDGREKGKL